MPDESDVRSVLAAYERQGATGSFTAGDGGALTCHTCDQVQAADHTDMLAMHRFEGASDPNDEAVLVMLRCPGCQGLGTMLLSYGPEASSQDMAVLAGLDDHRDESDIPSGA